MVQQEHPGLSHRLPTTDHNHATDPDYLFISSFWMRIVPDALFGIRNQLCGCCVCAANIPWMQDEDDPLFRSSRALWKSRIGNGTKRNSWWLLIPLNGTLSNGTSCILHRRIIDGVNQQIHRCLSTNCSILREIVDSIRNTRRFVRVQFVGQEMIQIDLGSAIRSYLMVQSP